MMSRWSGAAIGWGAGVLLAGCGAAGPASTLADSSANRQPAVAPASAAQAPELATFEIQAHRGGAGLVTENTLEAFGNALELGVTSLELDVRLTEDGLPVVTHDRRVSAL